jgi:hypothetical protein
VLIVPKVSWGLRVLFGGFAAVVLVNPTVWAQWRTPNKAGTIRTEIDPNAPAPRTRDGRPDFSGLFSPGPVTGSDLPYGAPVPFTNLPPRVSRASGSNIALGVPMTEAAEAILKARAARDFRDNPRSQCRPMGIVQLHTMGAPVKFLQTPDQLTLLYEANFERREIFLDGRALPGPNAQPFWNGYSVGKWDDDTLVVETSGFRDGGWLDMTGTPSSDAMRITERFRRVSLGGIEIDITIDDPKTFLRSFTVRQTYRLRLDDELIEAVCLENQKFGPEPGSDRSGPGSLLTPRVPVR